MKLGDSDRRKSCDRRKVIHGNVVGDRREVGKTDRRNGTEILFTDLVQQTNGEVLETLFITPQGLKIRYTGEDINQRNFTEGLDTKKI